MRPLVTLLALATVAGCAAYDPDVRLERFSDCDEMSDYMEKMAKQEVREQWSFEWGILGGTRGGWATDDMALEAGDVDQGSNSAGQWSDTNVQEAGVDEMDLVETDGTYIYSLAGGDLVIARAYPVDRAEQLSVTDIDGFARGIYLVEDTVVVLSELYWDNPRPRSNETGALGVESATTLVTIVDVSDRAAPVVERETYASGQLSTSRRIGEELFVVTYHDVDVAVYASDRNDAMRAVRTAEVEAWQSRTMDNRLVGGTWDVEEGTACGCEETFASDAQGGTFVSTVMVLDLTDPLSEFSGSAVVGRADTVYSSAEAMYVAYSQWEDGPFGVGDAIDSVIHKFDLTGDEPEYAATAEVPGYLHDQFSLSERNGVLRVATTDSFLEFTNGVYTLAEEDGEFVELDHLDGLAPGEEIMSARFIGDLGYVVTWEVQMGDPLFTFDLSDPSNIVLGGELHIPGWSDYLHPLDEGHLLAVGEEDWELQVSLFDVTDLSNPQLADRLFLEAWGSEAQWDHHAFNYFAPTQSLTLPSSDYEGGAVLEVVHADAEALWALGQIEQPRELVEEGYEWCAGIRRSVVMDDFVWAVSSAGLTAAEIEDPSNILATVPFDIEDPCADGYYGGGWDW